MKHIYTFLLLAFMACECTGQNQIGVTTNQTTCLVFPTAIRFVDRGSPDIATMQTKEAETMLLVKALKANFSQTNLSVVTNDGKLFSLIVHFDSLPTTLVYHPETYNVVLTNIKDKPAETAMLAENLLLDRRHRPLILKRKWGIYASLEDIYIKGGVFFFSLSLNNKSPIRFDLESLRFHVSDLKTTKRAAVQEREVLPIYVSGNTTLVEPGSINLFIVATNKFTLSDAKYFGVEIREQGGGRHLKIQIRNGHLMKAKALK